MILSTGLKAALSSFQTIAVFIITKNILDMVQVLATKLQKRNQDVFEAYKMIDKVVEFLNRCRRNIDTAMTSYPPAMWV